MIGHDYASLAPAVSRVESANGAQLSLFGMGLL